MVKVPGEGGAYKKLCAVVDTRPHLSLEIGGRMPDMVLQLWHQPKTHEPRRLVTSVPFEPGREDEAAGDLATRASMGNLHL